MFSLRFPLTSVPAGHPQVSCPRWWRHHSSLPVASCMSNQCSLRFLQHRQSTSPCVDWSLFPIRINFHLIQSYVPCLSPVKTQILMSALDSCSIVWGTPSCNLSSMAVAPSSWTHTEHTHNQNAVHFTTQLCFYSMSCLYRLTRRSFSISSYNWSSLPSLSSSAVLASWWRCIHWLKYSSSRSL